MKFDHSKIGHRLNALRIGRDLTQADIADILGVSQPNYARIEGGVHLPTLEQLAILSKFYKTSLDYLIMGKYPDPKDDNPTKEKLISDQAREIVHLNEQIRLYKRIDEEKKDMDWIRAALGNLADMINIVDKRSNG